MPTLAVGMFDDQVIGRGRLEIVRGAMPTLAVGMFDSARGPG